MKNSHRPSQAQGIVVDPVCGMSVDSAEAPSETFHGRMYHFCSEGCRSRFADEPERFVGDAGPVSMEERRAEPSMIAKRRESAARAPEKRSWTAYVPLLIVIGSAAAVGVAKQVAYPGPWSGMAWMHDFMGVFLVIFAMFKFFDLRGFSDGFRMYDLLAKRSPGYAYVYPFIELGLGLAYLTHQRLPMLYALTVVVMVFGALGVFGALRKGLNVNCACMGTVLKVPLSTVAVTENIGMAAMAAMMWVSVA